MMSPPVQLDRQSARPGFTMIELLIVLAIIGILLSISFVVYGAAVENAREAATKATLRQLDSAMQERLNAFQRVNLRSQAQQFKSLYDGATPVNSAPNPPTIPLEIAEIIVRKDRYRAAFPQRLEDLWGFDGNENTADDAPLWNVWKRTRTDGATTRVAPAPDPLESSELLYLALTNGGSFGAPVLTLDRLRANHVRDANNNGLNEIYDEWGQPLRFYNWPTRLVRQGGEQSAGPPIQFRNILVSELRATALPLIPSLPKTNSDLSFDFYSHPLNQDPDDPTGALINAQNLTGVGRGGFRLFNVLANPVTEDFFHTFDTYSVPLIVSAGPDGQLGLTEPALAGPAPQRLAEPTGSLDSLYDNITNRQP